MIFLPKPRILQGFKMNLDLRNGENDTSQRMLNAIEPGTLVPIHRHRDTSETVVCLRGKLVEEYYDDLKRMCTDSIMLTPNGQTVALNIPAGQWHTVGVGEWNRDSGGEGREV